MHCIYRVSEPRWLEYFIQNFLRGPMNGSLKAVSILYRVHTELPFRINNNYVLQCLYGAG